MKKYFLPIKIESLADYIHRAIILPTRFYNNRPIDIQDSFGDYLFLSTIPYVNDSNCSIELILTEEEELQLVKQDNIILLNTPLPISRIKHIYFSNNEEKLLIIGQINRGTGFINENIVKILSKKMEFTSNIPVVYTDNFKYSVELEARVKDFDKKLGGVAFVRFNTNNKYSKNYFSILSFFNSFIKEEYEKNTGLTANNAYNGAFSCDGAWKTIASLIYNLILEEDVIDSAKKENINITKDIARNFEYTKIDDKSDTYKLAILHTYGSDSTKRKSINDLVSSLINGTIEHTKHEGISLIFGINNGYTAFYNKYKEKIVKFKMDSMLDYYTVESIFQYVINHAENSYKFEYLNDIIDNKILEDDMYFETFDLLGERVITGSLVMSDIKNSEESGMFATVLFNRLKSYIEKVLKKKYEVEILLHQKQKKNEELETKIVSITENTNKLTDKNQYIESKFQEEQIKSEKLETRNLELLQQAKETEIQTEELNIKLQQVQQQLKEKNIELEAKVTDLNRNIKDKEYKLQEERNKLEEQKDKYTELVKQREDFKERVIRLNNEAGEYQTQLKYKKDEVIVLNTEITDFKKHIEEINIHNKNNESQLQEQKIKYENLIDKYSNLEQHVETLSQEIVEVQTQLQQKQEKNTELEASLEKARVIYRKQQSKIKSFEVKIDETPQKNQINLNSMRKPELLELAKQQGIHVSSKDTVQQLIDKINLNVSSLF